jgi:hypothetical protein
LPAPRVFLDGEAQTGVVSRLSHVGAYDLTIATTLPYEAVTAHSCFVGEGAGDCAAVHMVRAAAQLVRLLALPHSPGTPHDRAGRVRCLLEHYAQLQAALAETTGSEVRVELGDDALAVAGGHLLSARD